ncbi:hypothetical protein AAFF_G00008270 [Aldrovandia affinis]|uniref:Uncharacterized protein n=1 Tax=Aldrovandia affinis TaxID=143900 RepID=A0AAD7T645_9TELE|nr:hypothetical protein AAFF_G00008270 [Aldrovandia affinis]
MPFRFSTNSCRLTLPPPPGLHSQMPPPIGANSQGRSGRHQVSNHVPDGQPHSYRTSQDTVKPSLIVRCRSPVTGGDKGELSSPPRQHSPS